jgi:hypothetical protein
MQAVLRSMHRVHFTARTVEKHKKWDTFNATFSFTHLIPLSKEKYSSARKIRSGQEATSVLVDKYKRAS